MRGLGMPKKKTARERSSRRPYTPTRRTLSPPPRVDTRSPSPYSPGDHRRGYTGGGARAREGSDSRVPKGAPEVPGIDPSGGERRGGSPHHRTSSGHGLTLCEPPCSVVKARKAIRTFQNAGYILDHSVAHHSRDMKRSTLAKTLKQARIGLAEFLRHDP